MVETTNDNSNSNSDDSNADKPRKRTRLFGGRKNKAAETPAIVPEPAQKIQEQKIQETAASSADAAVETVEPVKAPTRSRKKPAEEPAKKAAEGQDKKAAVETAKAAAEAPKAVARPTTSLLFQAPDLPTMVPPRAGRDDDSSEDESPTVRRRSR